MELLKLNKNFVLVLTEIGRHFIVSSLLSSPSFSVRAQNWWGIPNIGGSYKSQKEELPKPGFRSSFKQQTRIELA